MTYRKKLIEVALPLDTINKESAREKSIRHGHPSTLHLWWARRPLAACRAVLFASLVDDPSNDLPEEEAKVERDRLFGILEDLVKWENSNDENVLDRAQAEIMRSTGNNPPPVLDPFCGGGSIPLEAQRLGLEAHGSDLNPVAVLITKALIEIPPKFAGKPPVNPESRGKIGNEGNWRGARGLAEDVRYYGKWMRDEAEKRIGHLYPKGPNGETVIAWLWARTVRCPNPACSAAMPLVSSFWLSKKTAKKAWVEPVVDREKKEVRFTVMTGEGAPRDGTVNRQGATCLVCDTTVPFSHVRAEGRAKHMEQKLMAVVAEDERGRKYITPTEQHVVFANKAKPSWRPEAELYGKAAVNVPLYGLTTFADLFTNRQLVALDTFSDLVSEARKEVYKDAIIAGLPDVGVPPDKSAQAYVDAVATYLGLGVSKLADYNSSLVIWSPTRDQAKATFARQAIPMVWDFTEINAFAGAAGDFNTTIKGITGALEKGATKSKDGAGRQADATASANGVINPLISTDPPYYDNISYADLADFFYVWLRRSLGRTYPDIFGTLLVPKTAELVATPYRFAGSKQKAQTFFEKGLGNAFAQIEKRVNPDYPFTVYYAFKQSESQETGNGAVGVASTGWETMLEGLLSTGFQITGTWPMRTERGARSIGIGANALASSIVLVCACVLPKLRSPRGRSSYER